MEPTTPSVHADDPLALTELFKGGGEPWLPALKPLIEGLPDAARFIGPGRSKRVVPVRELTFQALKPNPPERWRVVAFGQNPYPRVESATGIAMFDNAFHSWKDKRFEYVASMRNIIKAALIWRHNIPPETDVWTLRRILAEHQVVEPPEWFQAMLAQGVLLLNASLTASSDSGIALETHTAFWRPVAERIVEEILKAKQTAPPRHKGVVFAWWGTHARGMRAMVEGLQKKYPDVPVRHLDHWNPAARDDRFYRGNHFKDINSALLSVGASRVAWLPTAGWQERLFEAPDVSQKMGGFIKETMDLHRFYLDRLAGARDEVTRAMPAIRGVRELPSRGLHESLASASKAVLGLEAALASAKTFAKNAAHPADALSDDEVAAVHLYTMASSFYRGLNAALRDPDRAKAAPYLGYLRLLFSAFDRLTPYTEPLWRGVPLDLRAQYPAGETVAWWGVSSCTSKRAVAEGFMGSSGARTLFEIHPRSAVSIKRFSAFAGEEEFILAPGTQFKVADVSSRTGGLHVVTLEELDLPRLVS